MRDSFSSKSTIRAISASVGCSPSISADATALLITCSFVGFIGLTSLVFSPPVIEFVKWESEEPIFRFTPIRSVSQMLCASTAHKTAHDKDLDVQNKRIYDGFILGQRIFESLCACFHIITYLRAFRRAMQRRLYVERVKAPF